MSSNESFLTKVEDALKEFGEDLKKGAADVEKAIPIIAPLVAAFNPTAAAALDDFSSLASIVTNGAQTIAAEKGGSPSNVSLTSLMPQVSAFLTQTEALAGRTIVNQQGFAAGVTAIISAMQQLLSSVG